MTATGSSKADWVAAYQLGLPVPLALRVGVSGHRPHKIGDVAAIEAAINQVVRDIRHAFRAIDDEDAIAEGAHDVLSPQFYAHVPIGPELTVLSPLAEGADRMVATAAHRRGFQLVAVLPFAANEYRNDFKPRSRAPAPNEGSLEDPEHGTEAQFDELLGAAGARVILDGEPAFGERRNRSYLAAGRFVVAHSDVLIAIWDGQPADGTGGTGDIVEEARRGGIPIVHVFADNRASEGQGRLALLDPVSVELPNSAPVPAPRPYDYQALSEMLTGILRPPKLLQANARRQRTLIDERRSWRYLDVVGPDYRDRGPVRYRPPWRPLVGLFDLVRNTIVSSSRIGEAHDPDRRARADPEKLPDRCNRRPIDRLYAAYLHADAMSTEFSRAYRSSIMAIYLLGAFAVTLAVLALLDKDWKAIFTAGELAVLFAILGLLVLDRFVLRLHRRWLDYRLLAELLRPTVYLAILGATIRSSALHSAYENGSGGEPTHAPASEWVHALYRMIIRYAGVASVDLTDRRYVAQCSTAIAENLLMHQIAYHELNRNRSRLIDRRLKLGAAIAFFATIIAVSLKASLLVPGVEILSHVAAKEALNVLGFFAVFLPALAAAFYALRSHNELEILSERSEAMAERLMSLKRYVEDLGDEATSAERLTDAVRLVADIIMHDTSDWLEIFRVKETEAG